MVPCRGINGGKADGNSGSIHSTSNKQQQQHRKQAFSIAVAMSWKKFRDKYAIIRMAFLKNSDCFLEQGLERNKRRRWRQRGEGEAPHLGLQLNYKQRHRNQYSPSVPEVGQADQRHPRLTVSEKLLHQSLAPSQHLN